MGYQVLRLSVAALTACLARAVRVFLGNLLIVLFRFAVAAALRNLRRAAPRCFALVINAFPLASGYGPPRPPTAP